MITGSHQQQILSGIIKSITVKMMNVFVACQRATKFLLNDMSMLQLPLPSRAHFYFPIAGSNRSFNQATSPDWFSMTLLGSLQTPPLSFVLFYSMMPGNISPVPFRDRFQSFSTSAFTEPDRAWFWMLSPVLLKCCGLLRALRRACGEALIAFRERRFSGSMPGLKGSLVGVFWHARYYHGLQRRNCFASV